MLKNLYFFPIGSRVQSFYTGKVFIILEQSTNGMSTLLNTASNTLEKYNSHNNQHFVLCDSLSLGVLQTVL